MKYTLLAFLAIAAIATFGATQTTKEYVDTKASNTLVTAKSYTDAKAVEVTALIPNTNDFLTASWTNGLSVVAGQGASASGGVNTVIGSGAVAEGVGATAYGEMCRAIGQHAVAWGSARALGDYCVAMGLNAEAAAAYSLAIGKDSMAIQQYTFAAGTEAVASNYNAFVVGNQAKALGQDSMAVGNSAQAFDMKSTAFGFESVARGLNSSAIGSYSLAHGSSSLSAGAGSVAYGMYATAIGMSACASNSSAVAIGYNSKALHSSSLSFGSSAKSAGYNSVAVGASTEANQQSVAIGSGAKATGNQSVAIGRDAKATHTASVAIGPTAETTADSTIRIAYNPSEIMLGFSQPKSLRDYLDEVTPSIDWSIASNIVRNAEFLPSKYYRVYGGTTNEAAYWDCKVLGTSGRYSTSIELKPKNEDSLASLKFGNGAMTTYQDGGILNLYNGSVMRVGDPNSIMFGSGQNQTNFNNYVKAIAQSAGGGVDTNAVRDIIDAQIPNNGSGMVNLAYNASTSAGLWADEDAAWRSAVDDQVTPLIAGNTITNAGAVAAAMAQADGKFLQKTGGTLNGDLIVSHDDSYSSGSYSHSIRLKSAYSTAQSSIDYNADYENVRISSGLYVEGKFVVPSWSDIHISDSEYQRGWGVALPTYLASTAWHGTNKALADYGITNSIPPAYTDAEAGLVATNTFTANADYALTNLTAETLTLRSGEIGNYVAPTNFTLSLSFADNGRSGDCILYVENPHPFDSEIAVTTNTLNLVSADLAKALTLGRATTNIVTFTRVKANTILVGKVEVK